MSRKGQVTVEFIMIFIIFLAALTVGVAISSQKTQEVNQVLTNLEVTKILDDISNKIDIAVLEGPGFSINLILPEKILNSDYSVQVQSNIIYINRENTTYLGFVLTNNITGVLQKGVNTIENRDGNIIII